MAKDFEVKQVNETEVDIYLHGQLEFRLCLMNRMHDSRDFQVARPGIGGGFSTNYKWTFSFEIVSRNIYGMIASAAASHADRGMLDLTTRALMAGRRILIQANKSYLPRLRM